MNRPMPPRLDPKSKTERIQLIAPESWVARVNDWRRKQAEIPNFSEAVRLLVEEALEKKGGRK